MSRRFSVAATNEHNTSKNITITDWDSYTGKIGHDFEEAYAIARRYLKAKEVPSAEESARYLLCDVAGTGYSMSDFHRAMDAAAEAKEALPVLSNPMGVLSFWLGKGYREQDLYADPQQFSKMAPKWFGMGPKDETFEIIQLKHELLVRDAAAGTLNWRAGWTKTPRGMLAQVILLDQFSRCIYRGTPGAFQHDAQVKEIVFSLLQQDAAWLIENFLPIERFWLQLALQHSEDIDAHEAVHAMFEQGILTAGASEELTVTINGARAFSVEHYDVMKRFGRFPGRNAVLGRKNTAVEDAWLASAECPQWAKSQLPAAQAQGSKALSRTGTHKQSLSLSLSKVINRSNEWFLTSEQMGLLGKHCIQRALRMPVQYILGNWDFYGMELQCRAPVLVPRPETEELVDLILKSNILPKLPEKAKILDIGIGTGALGLALVVNHPGATCLGLDISAEAVQLATFNAAAVLPAAGAAAGAGAGSGAYTCKLQSIQDYVESGEGLEQYDIIVSNPPYLTSGEMTVLEPEVGTYEDRGALYGGSDGLDLIKYIVLNAARLLKKDGPGEVWMEVGIQHPEAIKIWMLHLHESSSACVRLKFVEGINDLSGRPRFVRLKLA